MRGAGALQTSLCLTGFLIRTEKHTHILSWFYADAQEEDLLLTGT